MKEKVHFVDIAIGSLEELHYQTILARDLRYIDAGEHIRMDDKMQRIGYLLSRLRKSLL